MKMRSLQDLPIEVLVKIFSYLDLKALGKYRYFELILVFVNKMILALI